MSTLLAIVGGSLILAGSFPFLARLILLGIRSVTARLIIFTNMGVESLHEHVHLTGTRRSLILIRLWVGGVRFLCTAVYNLNLSKIFSISGFILVFFSVVYFSVSNWFALYFLFEASLIPILILILGWGYQPERFQASTYLLIYTAAASLPMLACLILVFQESGTVSFFSNYANPSLHGNYRWCMLLLLSLAFMVKLPVFSVHTWLPKAHVEAPVYGSMLLAGVLLKFGGYGILILIKRFHFPETKILTYVMAVGLWGGLVCRIMCIRQVDIKSWIAYSSIGHMSLCLGGILTRTTTGWTGSLEMMLAHGLCSAGIFALANYCYTLYQSRRLIICSGLITIFPAISISWFLFCSRNIAFPPRFNLLGELFLILSLVSFSVWNIIPLGIIAFVAGARSLIIYIIIQHGSTGELSVSGSRTPRTFITITFLLWVPLNIVTISRDFFNGCYCPGSRT